MRVDGTIFPTSNSAGFTRDKWCEFIAHRPEFKRTSPKEAKNPFTGEVITVYPPEDAAEIEVDGRVIGEVYWSMSDEPLVNVSVEPSQVQLAVEWATALGGEFHADQ